MNNGTMKTIEIIGENHFDICTEHRTACRGIVVRDNLVLLSYEENRDQYGIPGGGMEENESLQECCRREIAEETGVVADIKERFLTIKEYYEQWCYETHFFACEPMGETPRRLTERECQAGLIPKWIPLEEVVSIFSKHQEYAETDEEKRGIYLREYLALSEFVECFKITAWGSYEI